MRPRLESTDIAIRDLADQPWSRFVLFVEDILGSKAALAVDRVWDKDGAWQAARLTPDGTKIVATFPYDAKWIIVSRDVIETCTVEEWARKKVKDAAAIKKLEEELKPDYAAVERAESGQPVVILTTPEIAAGLGRTEKSNYEPGPGVYA